MSSDDRARKAVETWTRKLVDNQRKTGQRVDASAARKQASEWVRQTVRKKNEKG